MSWSRRTRSRAVGSLLILSLTAFLAVFAVVLRGHETATATAAGTGAQSCAAGVDLFGFSEALNKRTFEGTNVGGLSGLTYDAGRDVYYGLVDNEGTTPTRFYTLGLPTGGSSLGEPEILDVATLRDKKGQQDVSSVKSLAASTVKPVQKELLVDLGSCPSGGATTAPGAVQANPLLDNFEALTLGPVLPDGRQSLVLVSDDNFNSSQTTRVIVLAVERDLLTTGR